MSGDDGAVLRRLDGDDTIVRSSDDDHDDATTTASGNTRTSIAEGDGTRGDDGTNGAATRMSDVDGDDTVRRPAAGEAIDRSPPIPTGDLRSGDAIADGRVVIRRLGGGDRFEAWLGWDDHLAAPVVLKVLRATHVDDRRARRAIAREGAHLARLAHPVIVRSFGADLEGPRPYIVLEFLDGPRLSTLIRRYGPLSPEQLVPLATEISSALSYLHHEEVLHLDVKPQNLIMGAPPRLIDLSIARRFADVPTLRGPLGTDAYMAPEQCRVEGLERIGPATDVWGLGATLYEAVNGYRPFRPRDRGEPHPQLSEGPRAFHARVPPVLRDVIAACLRVDASARPTLDELRDTFEQLAPEAQEVATRRLRRRMR